MIDAMAPATTTTSAPQLARGVLALVVGPSGAGKDSLINAARRALAGDARVGFARRVVTRAAQLDSEDHDTLSPAEFEQGEAEGRWALSWRAHGLAYGIPVAILPRLAAGGLVVANVSRGAIADAERLPCGIVAIHVTAPPDVLLERLRKRGREPQGEARQRVLRDAPLTAARARIVEVRNDGALADAEDQFIAVLRGLLSPAGARAE